MQALKIRLSGGVIRAKVSSFHKKRFAVVRRVYINVGNTTLCPHAEKRVLVNVFQNGEMFAPVFGRADSNELNKLRESGEQTKNQKTIARVRGIEEIYLSDIIWSLTYQSLMCPAPVAMEFFKSPEPQK